MRRRDILTILLAAAALDPFAARARQPPSPSILARADEVIE